MRRWATFLIVGGMTAISMAAAILWVYSWFYFDAINLRVGRTTWQITSMRGGVMVILYQHPPEVSYSSWLEARNLRHDAIWDAGPVARMTTDRRFMGIGIGHRDQQRLSNTLQRRAQLQYQQLQTQAENARATGDAATAQRLTALAAQRLRSHALFVEAFEFPYWLVVLLAGLFPLWQLAVHVRHRRRVATGHCRICGYDLRATPDRCPECGTEIGRPPKSLE